MAMTMPAACARYPRTAWPSPGSRAEHTMARRRRPSGIGTSAGMKKRTRGVRLYWRRVCFGWWFVVGMWSQRAARFQLCRCRPDPEGLRCDSGRSNDPTEIRTGRTASPGTVRSAHGYLPESGARCIWGISSVVPSVNFNPHRRASRVAVPHCIRRYDAQPPSVSRTSLRLLCRHVKIGVSRSVYRLPSVSRRAITRSRKSSGLSDSNATTHS